MKRGEVWWWQAPDEKPRPVCILTRDDAIPVLTSLLVVPATTRWRGIATEVALELEDGMPKPCVLTLDSPWTVSKALLVERITRLPPSRMHEVCGALAVATGC